MVASYERSTPVEFRWGGGGHRPGFRVLAELERDRDLFCRRSILRCEEGALKAPEIRVGIC